MEHNGIKIEFNERIGKFSAVRNGKPFSGNSLAGIKKALDKDAADGFQPFKALVDGDRWRSNSLREVTIVGIKFPRANQRYSHPKWIDQNRLEYSQVMADTPENRKAISNRDRVSKERADADKKMRVLEEAAEAKIVKLEPKVA